MLTKEMPVSDLGKKTTKTKNSFDNISVRVVVGFLPSFLL